MPIPQKILDELGFKDNAEWSGMVASVDLSTRAKRQAFEKWKLLDGSKAGLEPLLGAPKINPTELRDFAVKLEDLARKIRESADALEAGDGDPMKIALELDSALEELTR